MTAEQVKRDSPVWEANTRLNTQVDEMAIEIERLRRLLAAILEADERGQGQPWLDAIYMAHRHLYPPQRKL